MAHLAAHGSSYFDLKNPVQARTPFTMRDL